MRLSLVLLLTLTLAACSGSPETPTEVTEEGVNVENNPLGALGAFAGLGDDLKNLQEELANMPEAEAVHFNELIKALPDVPSGWTADDPRGSTNQMGDFKTSEASRTYRRDDSDERVTVTVQDWAYNQAVYVPFMMQARFSQETTEGYSKGIKMGDNPGREEYQTGSQSGSRSVLVHKRYHTKIDIDNLATEAFDEWWGRVKIAELPTS